MEMFGPRSEAEILAGRGDLKGWAAVPIRGPGAHISGKSGQVGRGDGTGTNSGRLGAASALLFPPNKYLEAATRPGRRSYARGHTYEGGD